MQRIKKRKKSKNRQIIGIIILSFSILLALGGITGSKFLGELGGYIQAHFLLFTFGYPVLIVSFLLFLFGWFVFFGKRLSSLFSFSAYSLIFMCLLSYGLSYFNTFVLQDNPLGDSFHLGGNIGVFLADKSNTILGVFGSIVILLTVFAIYFIALFDIEIEKKYHFIEDKIRSVFSWIGAILGKHYNNWQRLRTFRKQRKKKVLERKILMKRTSVDSDDDEEETPIIREPEDTKITIQKKNDYEEAKVIRTAKVGDGEYIYPPIDILDFPPDLNRKISEKEQIKKAEVIERTLLDFGIEAKVVNVNPGPVITLYEVSPAPGVKISKIAGLADDLALSMSAKGIRIIAPIPGKSVVGIEIPNKNPSTVYLRALLSSEKFRKVKSKLAIAIGESIDGDAYIFDLAKMPHLLIAGSTGSGKSVGVNTIIINILYRALPDEVQFALIDPKKLELSIYKKLINHHLLTVDGIDEDVITKPDNAVTLLKCLEKEMERRYTILAKAGVRNIADFNSTPHKDEEIAAVGKLSYIVVVIDELADLMITSGKEIEESVARLAQMSRAVGIHLVIATQRPSVDVLTGVIKANFSSRIAYQVASKVDSRTILDMNGAEQLMGKGDMLFLSGTEPKPIRIQNAFVSTKEIEKVVDAVLKQPKYKKAQLSLQTAGTGGEGYSSDERDPLFKEARKLVIMHQQGSISLLQRRLKIGYSRAARLVDQLEFEGIVGAFDGSKARKVLYDESFLDEFDD